MIKRASQEPTKTRWPIAPGVGANYGRRSVLAADVLAPCGPSVAVRCSVVRISRSSLASTARRGRGALSVSARVGRRADGGGVRLPVQAVGQHRERRAGTDHGSASGRAPAPPMPMGVLCSSCALCRGRSARCAAAERAVAIVVGSSRRRRGRRTRGERLVRRSADCAVTIAPLGFRARVAGLLDAHAASR